MGACRSSPVARRNASRVRQSPRREAGRTWPDRRATGEPSIQLHLKHGLPPGSRLPAPGGSGAGDRATQSGRSRGRAAPGAAGRHRLRKDVHHRQGDRADRAAHSGSGAQQDAGGAALPGVQVVLPDECGGVFRQLLRLLPARGLHSLRRCVYREGSHHQRRARQAAPVRHAVAVRAARLHHRRQRELHLRPGVAGGLLRHAAHAREGAEDQARGYPAAAGGDPLRAQRRRFPPRHVPGARRRDRALSHLRRQRVSDRAVGRRDRKPVADRSAGWARFARPTCGCRSIRRRTTS